MIRLDARTPAGHPVQGPTGWHRALSPLPVGERERAVAFETSITRLAKTGIMLQSALMNVMIKAARRAGRSLKRDLGEIENLQVSLKGPANFVSLADKRAEEMLYEDLTKARPGYGFIGEEGGTREGTDKSNTWIVDPLDGTTNFLHGIPQFAISIGLRREDTVIAGLIYNPANDELYVAERGKGAFLNDQRLRVAGRRKLNDCVVACGLPHIGRGDHDLSRREMTEIQNRVAGLRRFGAASLDMAFVAAGRLDGYWERNLQAWDMAAGAILIKEAGGVVSCVDGESDPLKTGNLICGNEYIHAELVKIIKPLGK
jgi:myo-inositol-1(or 4)-monophosphatase